MDDSLLTNTYCFNITSIHYELYTLQSPHPKIKTLNRILDLGIPVVQVKDSMYLFYWNHSSNSHQHAASLLEAVSIQSSSSQLILEHLTGDNDQMNDLYTHFIQATHNLWNYRLETQLGIQTLGKYNLFPLPTTKLNSTRTSKRFMPVELYCYWMSGYLFFQPRVVQLTRFQKITVEDLNEIKNPKEVYLCPSGVKAMLYPFQKPISAMRKELWSICACEKTRLITVAFDNSNSGPKEILYPVCCIYYLAPPFDVREKTSGMSPSCTSALRSDELMHATLKGLESPESVESFNQVDKILSESSSSDEKKVFKPPLQATEIVQGRVCQREPFSRILSDGFAAVEKVKAASAPASSSSQRKKESKSGSVTTGVSKTTTTVDPNQAVSVNAATLTSKTAELDTFENNSASLEGLSGSSPLMKEDMPSAVYTDLDFSMDQMGNIGDLGVLNLDEVDMTDFDFFGGGAVSTSKKPTSTSRTNLPSSSKDTPERSFTSVSDPVACSPFNANSIAQSSPAYTSIDTPLPATPFDINFSPRGSGIVDMMSPPFHSPPENPLSSEYTPMESPSLAGQNSTPSNENLITPPSTSGNSGQFNCQSPQSYSQSQSDAILIPKISVEADTFVPIPALSAASPSSSPTDDPEEAQATDLDDHSLHWPLVSSENWLPFRIKEGLPFSEILGPDRVEYTNRYGSLGKWSYQPKEPKLDDIVDPQLVSAATWTGCDSSHVSKTVSFLLKKELEGIICSRVNTTAAESCVLHPDDTSLCALNSTVVNVKDPLSKSFQFILVREAFEQAFKQVLIESSSPIGTAATPSSSKSLVTSKPNGWLSLAHYLDIQDPSSTIATYGSFQVKKKKRGTELSTELLVPPHLAARCNGVPVALYEWSIRFWDKLSCEPLFGPKNVEYIALIPTVGGSSLNEAKIAIAEGARSYLKDLIGTYSTCRLGKLAPMYVNERPCFVAMELASLELTVTELEATYVHWITQVLTFAASGKLQTVKPGNQFIAVLMFIPNSKEHHQQLHVRVQAVIDEILVRTGFSYLKGSFIVKSVDLAIVTSSSYQLESIRTLSMEIYDECRPVLFDESTLKAMPVSSTLLCGIPAADEPYLDPKNTEELPPTSIMIPERILFLSWDYELRSAGWSDSLGLLQHSISLEVTETNKPAFFESVWDYFLGWCQSQGVIYHVVLLPFSGAVANPTKPCKRSDLAIDCKLWKQVMKQYLTFLSLDATRAGSFRPVKRCRLETKYPVASVCFFHYSQASHLELYSLRNLNAGPASASSSTGNSPIDHQGTPSIPAMGLHKVATAGSVLRSSPAFLKYATALFEPGQDGWVPESSIAYVIALAHHRRPYTAPGSGNFLFPLATGWLVDMHPLSEVGPGVSPYASQQGDLLWHIVLAPVGDPTARAARTKPFIPWYTQSSPSSTSSLALEHNYFVMCKQILKDLFRARSHKGFIYL